jgi:hypothetical protein
METWIIAIESFIIFLFILRDIYRKIKRDEAKKSTYNFDSNATENVSGLYGRREL